MSFTAAEALLLERGLRIDFKTKEHRFQVLTKDLEDSEDLEDLEEFESTF